jgi:hypothetical protein
MTDASFDQIGKGSAAECGSPPAATQCRFASGSTALVTTVQSVRASSIPVFGGSGAARSAGRSYRSFGADYAQGSTEHGAPAASVCEKQWSHHRGDRDTCLEHVSEYAKKAWLSGPQDASRFKSMLSMRLIVCTSRNLSRSTVFWRPAESILSAGV